MQIMILSMITSEERRRKISELMACENISFTFFNATNIHEIRNHESVHNETSQKTLRRKNYFLTDSEIACAYSHIKMWEKVVEDNENTIILEDNFRIEDQYIGRLSTLLNNIYQSFCKNNLNYLKISHQREEKLRKINFQVDDNFNIGYSQRTTAGTSGYIISPKAAKQLIKRYKEIIEPVDDFIEKPWRSGISVQHLSPAIIHRDKQTKSQIGSNRKRQRRKTTKAIIMKESFRFYEQLMHKLYRIKFIRKSKTI